MDLSSLNMEQLEAVLHKDGPLLVFAGAGSGKTRVITYRIANLIYNHGIPPHHILAVTFTNKAANEMKERLQKLIGNAYKGLWVGTFHSICVRILRESGRAVGVEPNFVVYDDRDQAELIRQIMIQLDIDEKQFSPRAISSAISRAKERLITPEEYAERASDYYERIVARVYRLYQPLLQANNALDFDDLINKAIELLQDHRPARERYQDQFRYILVDEYQDVNFAQYLLISLLAEKHRNLCVVGDDDQAIYSFRGAEVELILRFEKDYPDAKVVKLERNYRSTQIILDAAFRVVSQNKHRAPKKLWTERKEGAPITLTYATDEVEEARIVAEYILTQVRRGKRRFGDFAVLYRTNAQSRVFEERFMREGIPFRIVGALRFFDRKEIKDLLAYLRLLVNPDDSVSLRRVINTPPRKIGEQTIQRVQSFASERGISLYRALNEPELLMSLPANARNALQGFVRLIEELRELAEHQSLIDTTKALLERTGYLRWLDEKGDEESQDRASNLREFVNLISQYEGESDPETPRTLQDFLQYVALVSDLDTLDDRGDQVVLMTLHAAKGLEFPVVFLVGLEAGLLPHIRSETPREIEEERRLCYVGMTRPMDELHLTLTMSRGQYGTRKPSIPSPFLKPLADKPMHTLLQMLYGSTPAVVKLPTGNARPAVHQANRPIFIPGQRVMHPELGSGIVVRTTDQLVTVMFPGGKGMRSFTLNECPLQEA